MIKFAFSLNSEDHIQMVTALALELIQCVVKLPVPDEEETLDEKPKTDKVQWNIEAIY